MVGPTIQDELTVMALQIHYQHIAFSAGVPTMFLQIRVSESDADMQIIFCRNNPDEPLNDYRPLTVTRGTISAPFLATRTTIASS
jgi:hypothetical protein